MHLNKQTKAFVSPAPVSSAFEMVFSAFPGTLALLPHHLSSLFLPEFTILEHSQMPLLPVTAENRGHRATPLCASSRAPAAPAQGLQPPRAPAHKKRQPQAFCGARGPSSSASLPLCAQPSRTKPRGSRAPPRDSTRGTVGQESRILTSGGRSRAFLLQ